jgi:hypothetical protein
MFFNEFPYTDFHELNADFLLKNYKILLENLTKLNTWMSKHEKEYEELKAIIDEWEAGNLPDEVYDKLKLWFINNYYEILGEFIKFISFTLNDQGYLVATIPDSLSELVFNTTGLDIFTSQEPEYGHLTLSY